MPSTSSSTPSPVAADTGKYSLMAREAAAWSWRRTCPGEAASTLLTTRMAGPPAGMRAATHWSPRPNGAVASITRTTTSTSSAACRAESLSRVPSNVRGRWIPGVSTNTICASGRLSTPRTWVRVVWGLSDTIETLVPSIRFSSVDLPTFGRPTRVTNPDRSAGPSPTLVAVAAVAVVAPVPPVAAVAPLAAAARRPAVGHARRGRPRRRDADPADAAALDLLGREPVPVAHDRLTLVRDVAQQVEDEPPDRVPVALRQLGVQELVGLVDREPGVHPEVAVGERLHEGLLDVVLVDDLADQLLDQVPEGDDTGRPAVLVHDYRHVELLVLHLPHQSRDPFGLGHEAGLPDELAHRSPRLALSLGPHEVLGVHDAHHVVDALLVDGDAAVAGRDGDLDDVADRVASLHGDHVGPRLHDLPHDRVAELEDRVDQRPLL